MNINRELKIIWWAPERCATKVTAEILKKFGFEVINLKNNSTLKFSEAYHSHQIIFPEGYEDYRLICNVRNPYDRVLSFYLNFTSNGRSFVYLKNKKEELQKRINTYVHELFEYSINQKMNINFVDEVPIRDYVTKLTFDGKIPDQLIRMENLEEDLSNLDFLRESNFWKSGEIQEIVQNNKFRNSRPFEYRDLYTIDSAAKVFNYFRKHFFICDYDPFSFSKEQLSNEDKIKFLHEIC